MAGEDQVVQVMVRMDSDMRDWVAAQAGPRKSGPWIVEAIAMRRAFIEGGTGGERQLVPEAIDGEGDAVADGGSGSDPAAGGGPPGDGGSGRLGGGWDVPGSSVVVDVPGGEAPKSLTKCGMCKAKAVEIVDGFEDVRMVCGACGAWEVVA